VLVFNSNGRFLYLPGQTPLRLSKARAKKDARHGQNEEAKATAELAIAAWVRQSVTGPIIFEPRVHQRGRWVVRRAPHNSSAIASAMGATLGTARAALACQRKGAGAGDPKCPLANGGTVVAFTRPSIHGDSAHVVLVRWQRAGAASAPAQEASVVTLVRAGTSWQIVRTAPRQQATG